MEVKIYREPENESLMIDESHLEEYNKLAAELGLQSLEDSEKQKTPNVYMCLNDAMVKQLKTLCPCKSKAEDYKRTTIPLEVLKVYKYAKDNEMFDSFEVWYADKEPDPLLIGRKWRSESDKSNGYDWNKQSYLIARWGDCAMELEELLEKGFLLIKQNLMDSVEVAFEKIESMKKNPDLYVRKFLKGENLRVDIETGTGSNF